MSWIRSVIFAGLVGVVMFVVAGPPSPAVACGNKWQQHMYVLETKEEVTSLPRLRLQDALAYSGLMPLSKESSHARGRSQSQYQQTVDADLRDLACALEAQGRSFEPMTRYAAIRTQLAEGRAGRQFQLTHGNNRWTYYREPVDFDWSVPDGLPEEFRLYMRGAIHHYNREADAAAASWQALLRLPPKQRRYRTVWAMYMLGRSVAGSDPDAAVRWYLRCEAAAKEGYSDSLGLRGASLGWRAQSLLLADDYLGAMKLYRQGEALGDSGCGRSLADLYAVKATDAIKTEQAPRAARLIFELLQLEQKYAVQTNGFTLLPELLAMPEASLRTLATIPQARELLTAYCASDKKPQWYYPYYTYPQGSSDDDWLAILESISSPPIRAAGLQAWLAYSMGDYAIADRWSGRATKNDVLALYVHAKLALRDGDFALAAQRYGRLTDQLRAREDAVAGIDGSAADDDWGYYHAAYALDRDEPWGRLLTVENTNDGTPDRVRIWSEYATVLLHEGRYIEALDAFALHAEELPDAAYVAEQVLTADELIDWVDRNAPSLEGKTLTWSEEIRYRLRWVLARRLMREGRRTEALPYFDAELRPLATQLDAWLTAGRDPLGTARSRAESLWQAAQITRHEGLWLLGTELAPDHMQITGHLLFTHVLRSRAGLDTTPERPGPMPPGSWPPSEVYPPLTRGELARLEGLTDFPTRRFHYRYVAAELAWEAASFLPDGTYQQAMVLHNGGHFIKGRDPELADRWYKAMVNQNRGIPFVEQADEERWFLDVVRITWDPLPASRGDLLYSLP